MDIQYNRRRKVGIIVGVTSYSAFLGLICWLIYARNQVYDYLGNILHFAVCEIIPNIFAWLVNGAFYEFVRWRIAPSVQRLQYDEPANVPLDRAMISIGKKYRDIERVLLIQGTALAAHYCIFRIFGGAQFLYIAIMFVPAFTLSKFVCRSEEDQEHEIASFLLFFITIYIFYFYIL